MFIILKRFCNAREKMLTNSLPYAAWVVFFLSDFRYDLWKKKFHFSITTTKPYAVLNKI